MSMHNLLELDHLNDNPVKDSPGTPKPKPRIRRSTTKGGNDYPLQDDVKSQPRPKPRRGGVERDVDEVRSMSSVSSGGEHVSRSAYDNPVFQTDEGLTDHRKPPRRKSPRSNMFLESSESEVEQTRRLKPKARPSAGDDAKNSSYSHKVRYDKMLHAESSAWDEEEEETYLYIENEGDSQKTGYKKKPKGHEKDEKSRSSSLTYDNEVSVENSPKRQRKKGDHKPHVTIQLEENIESEDTKDQKDPAKISPVPTKPKLSIWERFRSKSSTTSQPDPSKQDSKSLSKQGDVIDKSSIKEKETHIEILSDNSLADDESHHNKSQTTDQVLQDKPTKIVEEVPTTMKMQERLQLLKQKGKKKLQSFKSEDRTRSTEKAKEQTDTFDKEDEDEELEEQEIKSIFKSKVKAHKKAIRALSSEKSIEHRTFTKGRRTEIEDIDEPKRDSLLGITIHGSDFLPLDSNVLHPVVKVTLMTKEGKFIPKTDGFVHNPVRSDSAKTSKSRFGQDEKKKRRKRREDTIMPIMTQPFKSKLSYINPTFAPAWNELLLFEEPFYNFLEENPDLIIFFEILDFLPMEKTDFTHAGLHGTETGWYKIAWAFLKPMGANGVQNIDQKLRLQLFKPLKLRNREILDAPEVFSWWKSGRRDKLVNTTLYVTVKGVNPLTTATASLRQLLSMRKEDLTDAITESQIATSGSNKHKKHSKRDRRSQEKVDVRRTVNWTRLEGQSCKIPNKFLASLPSSQIQSLNLTISGNVHCLKFSPCGLKLAAGLDTEELHAVLVFQIPSGNLLRSLKNHHGLIYDLSWKQLDIDDDNYIQYIASASADSTACVWKMKNNNENSLKLVKTLHHPSFVYCVRFHPTNPSLVVTGCYDFIIRVWSIKSVHPEDTVRTSVNDASPLFILNRHCSFLNALLFDINGTYLFSGDGEGCLLKWQTTPSHKKSWAIEKNVKLTENGKVPINSLALHPNGIRLLVHLRDSTIRILDSTTFIQLKVIRGIVNDSLQIRSGFSPCGNLIFSGSEDPTICIWDSDTYAVKFMSPQNHPNCFVTSVDYHPFDFYLAVGVASTISEPNPILLYTYEFPKLSQVAMIQTGVAKFKSNLRKSTQPTDSRKVVKFASKRGDSSEKFLSIIIKLDKALKESQDPTRLRNKSKTLRRSVSIDVPDSIEKFQIRKISRPSSATGHPSISLTEKLSGSLSDSDVAQVPKPKYKSKSPRTFIEDRLEELILPSRKTPEGQKREETDINQMKSEFNLSPPPTAPKRYVDVELMSPKHLPKPRRERPQSSKIPIRSSPKKGVSEESSQSQSVPSSPIGRPGKYNTKSYLPVVVPRKDHIVPIEVPTAGKFAPNEPVVPTQDK